MIAFPLSLHAHACDIAAEQRHYEELLEQHVAEAEAHGHFHFDEGEETVDGHLVESHGADPVSQELPVSWMLHAQSELMHPLYQEEWSQSREWARSADEDQRKRPPRS